MTATTLPNRADRVAHIRFTYKLTQPQAMLLDALVHSNYRSVDELVEIGVAPTEASVRPTVTRLRQFLRKNKKIELHVQYGLGYMLENDAKKQLLNELYPEG